MRADEAFGVGLELRDEARELFVVLREQGFVTVAKIDRPRADDAGVGPRRAAIRWGTAIDVRNDGGDRTIGLLGIGDVALPFVEESRDIAIPCGGADENLGITGPTETFVALRAIGGHFEEVPALAPIDVALKLIDERIATGEITGARGVAVEHNSSDRVGRQSFVMSAKFDIAESVKGEFGLPRLAFGIAAEGVEIGDASFTKIVRVEGAVFVEHFTVAQANHLPGFAFDFEANASGDILSKIEDPG